MSKEKERISNKMPTCNSLPITHNSLWLYRFSLVVVFATLLLILAGGLVTSHQAGLAVPDWPTSYGQWFPPMVGNVFWEHGHRMIAGSVGILTLILVLWMQFREKRKWLKRVAWISFGAVILQALLGGLTVIYMLPAPISIFHACLAQTFFCLVVSLAYFLKPRQESLMEKNAADLEQERPSRLKRLLMMTTGFIYLQLILGATIRHSQFTPVPHILVAFLVLIHVLLVVLRVTRLEQVRTGLRRSALGLGLATVCQFFLGIGSFVFTRMLASGYSPSTGAVFFTAAHQTTGTVILATSVLMTLMVCR